MLLDLTVDKSTLFQVMAWCRQATSHYLSQCWPRSLSPHGVTRPQWINSTPAGSYYSLRHHRTVNIASVQTFMMPCSNSDDQWVKFIFILATHNWDNFKTTLEIWKSLHQKIKTDECFTKQRLTCKFSLPSFTICATSSSTRSRFGITTDDFWNSWIWKKWRIAL